MENLLVSLGINVVSTALYDFLKTKIAAGTTLPQLTSELSSFLNIEGQNIKAQKIISFLAESGQIKIENSKVYSAQSITMGSAGLGSFSFGNNSTSATPSTAIEAGSDAYITGKGSAQIRQNDDGSISFHV